MTPITLSPAQQVGHDRMVSLHRNNTLVGFVSRTGTGRTVIFEHLTRSLGAQLLRMGDFSESIKNFQALEIEEALAEVLQKAISEHDTIIVDDFGKLQELVFNCYGKARPTVWGPAFDSILHQLQENGKKMIVGLHQPWLAPPLDTVIRVVHKPVFSPDDFRHIFNALAGEQVRDIDFVRVHRFVPKLTARQMQFASSLLEPGKSIDTEAFLDLLEAHALASNVNTEEVEAVSLDSLHGVDAVIRQMDIDIIVPMERPDLVESLGLKPKRGVLLYGPPGTGKTTIGRALAHRLRSKFFLIDGTVISGTQDFYNIIQRIFSSAKDNAPSIIFIDDCDLLFENEEHTGLYRYLLTMLDGLESKGNSQVTVILTAMNIGSLPPALIRSGRVELWLEMKLPDIRARKAIIDTLLKGVPESLQKLDVQVMAEATKGMTGADLKRVMADAVNLYGYDIAREYAKKSVAHYFERAVAQLKHHRKQLESAPRFTAAHHGAASTRIRE